MPTETHPSKTDIQHEADQASVIAGNNTADAFFNKLDAKSRLYAKKLHAAGIIYALYGALDGLSLSYSTIKYCFDVFLTNTDSSSSSDVMHDWLLTPAGIAIAATESITIIAFSLMANHFTDENKNQFKRFIAVLWPYARDVLKGLKNGYKGVRSAVQVTNMLGGVNLNFLMLPVGLLLSGLAVLNRLWYRHMKSLRKDMMTANAAILADINSEKQLTPEELAKYRAVAKQNSQSKMLRTKGLLSAAYSGVVDSLYLYVGVLGLCSLAWPALIAMTVFCVIYSISCILTRIYEEYDFQRKLVILNAKIDLALYTRENSTSMQAAFDRLNAISLAIANGNKSKALASEQDSLAVDMHEKIKILIEKRTYLQSVMTLSNTSAFLAGVKNGLAAYSALTSIMFALSTIFLLTSTAFPPALLIACVSAGFVLLMAFGMHSLIKHYRHRVTQEVANQPYDRLIDMLKVLKDSFIKEKEKLGDEVKKAVDDGLEIQSAPSFSFQEWFEVIRSFFSGLGKGSKSVDYAFNPLQEAGSDGHYHDTPVLIILSILSSMVYAVGMALQALARGFGRPPIDQVAITESVNDSVADNIEEAEIKEVPSPVSESLLSTPVIEAKCAKISPQADVFSSSPSQESGNVKQIPDSAKRKPYSPLQQFSIFSPCLPVAPSLPFFPVPS
ncbi:MAG: hypothetical protein Q8M03_09380 [Legionella sp.]|nr:hypothetical protein [Legionella sp.]